ncbi:MAG: oligopeptide/dipeptide ABC transporter ATP-binding protein [Gemmobacter sp.]
MTVLRARISVAFPGAAAPVLDGVPLHLAAGEVVALVGESGSGKTLLARAIAGCLPAEARLDGGLEVAGRVGLIAQAPRETLVPVLAVGQQIRAVLHARGARAGAEAVAALLRRVGLAPEVGGMLPQALSGGMAQRVAVALALAAEAAVLIADEPTSALDGPAAAMVLALLAAEARAGRAVLVITHDLALAAAHSDRIVVMHAGQAVEEGPAASVIGAPAHPYTRALVAASPAMARRLSDLAEMPGHPPDPAHPLPPCRFAPRCARRQAQCDAGRIGLRPFAEGEGRRLACVEPG